MYEHMWKHMKTNMKTYFLASLLYSDIIVGPLAWLFTWKLNLLPLECLVCGSVVFGKAFYLLSASFTVVKVWPLLRDQLCAFLPRWECTLPSNINQLLWQSDKAGGIDSPIHIFNSWHPRQLTKQETITCLVLPNRLTSWIIVICLEPLRFNLQ